jgi:hypothetical protein
MKAPLILLSCAALFLASCEKNDSAVEPVKPAVAQEDVVLKEGILVFKNRNTMREYNSMLNAKGFDYSNAWEKEKGFESIARILNEVKKAERQLEVDFLRGKTPAELQRLRHTPAPHSAQYTKWVNAGVLRVTKDSDGAESFDVNASHTHFTNVMNAEGFVAFGDTLFQFKGNQIKSTTKGLSGAVALRAASATDPQQQIVVKESAFCDEQNSKAQKRGTGEVTFNNSDKTEVRFDNDKRATIIKTSLYSEILYDARKQNFVDFWIEAWSREKDFWGNWRDADYLDGIYAIEGNWAWNAVVNPNYNSSYPLVVPGFTRGTSSVYYAPSSYPGYIKLDRTTGAPQFGNQLFPNGTYTPYFDPSLGYNYVISRGIKLDNGSVFKCIPRHHWPEAILTWRL